MENHKLGTCNREIPTTKGSANQTRFERTQARWSFILILLGMFCLGVGFAQADDDAARPVKNLEEADGQIHWPDEMELRYSQQVELLREVFGQQYLVKTGQAEAVKEHAPGVVRTPHDPDAQWSAKGQGKEKKSWVG
jgi:hypothetical protein